MGCPTIYYYKALQYFAHCLAYDEDKKLASKLLNEKSTEKLENLILDQKSKILEKEFFFNAGIIVKQVLTEADEDGVDSFNAAIAGLNEFEYFIGLFDDDD